MTTVEFDTDSANFRVADWEVRPRACEIARNGIVIKLEPRVMELLQLLASRPGEVFTRIQLEEQVWPGMVVGYDALTKSIGKLREALGDTSKPSTYIQTIPKKGYRLIVPVTSGSTASPETLIQAVSPTKVKRFTTISLIFIATMIGISLITVNLHTEPALDLTEQQEINSKSSLVVLPFKNLNADPQQDYFSQGITDDLITDLSSYSGIEVISSRVAFQYRGRDVDLKTLVNKLGVRYVVEGSIRRTRQQIRINVQMIDTQRGTNLWAEQYNRSLTSLFDIQDEVRSRIVSALSLKLSEAERKRKQKRYTNNYDAYDAFLRGQNSLIKRESAEDNLQAREHFERAIAIDPGFARAYSALAMVNADAYRHGWAINPNVTARISLQQAKHALELDPESRHASLAMGYVEFFVSGNHQQAAEMAERTLQLDPKNADANMLLATIYVHADEYDKAEAYVESSMRLNANHPSIYFGIGALTNLLQGNYQAARLLYDKSLRINPGRLFGKIYMTITLVRMNRLNEARWYVEEIKATSPDFDAGIWVYKQPYKNRQINKQFLDDLRKAGLE